VYLNKTGVQLEIHFDPRTLGNVANKNFPKGTFAGEFGMPGQKGSVLEAWPNRRKCETAVNL
jgi:hypothetical protein